jgi:hypothetical protein
MEPGSGAVFAVYVHQADFGIHFPNQRDAGTEMLLDFLVDFRDVIVGGYHFDDQVGPEG